MSEPIEGPALNTAFARAARALEHLNHAVGNPKATKLFVGEKLVRQGVMDHYTAHAEYDGSLSFRVVFEDDDIENIYLSSNSLILTYEDN